MINKRSRNLVVLIASYNRLSMLKDAVRSVAKGTICDHEIVVVDGGSTDGTVDWLQAQGDRLTPVYQGKLLGTARAYNDVWREIDCTYTCWLSDDTEITAGALDTAISLLEKHPAIGMVGLKMRDVEGPFTDVEYMGAVSEHGILNCNHGVVRMPLLKQLGYFNEAYRSYTIDPDLTASVLSSGHNVVMTRSISVLHHRTWFEHEGEGRVQQMKAGIDNEQIYRDKFAYLGSRYKSGALNKIWRQLVYRFRPIFFPNGAQRFGLSGRDAHNLLTARFMSLRSDNEIPEAHLVQRIPKKLLHDRANPYLELALRRHTSEF